ncbi:MAG TPA: oligopeptide ABC transporter permease [Longimicrobium sp.]|nr:oligopeptide ABC transporter permease [Longimicrobium sp.]
MRASPHVESVPPEPLPPATPPPAAAAPAGRGGLGWSRFVWLLLAWGLVGSLAYLSRSPVKGTTTLPMHPVGVALGWATLALVGVFMLWWTWRLVGPGAARRARTRGDSQWAIAGRHFRKNRLAMAGLVVMILLYVITLITPLIAPYHPEYIRDMVLDQYLPPSSEHLLGTDKFGRDVLTRMLYGSRISLSIGFIAVGISITLGTLVGALSGYFGGWVDAVLMRFTDLMLSFPRLVLLIVVIAVFENSSIFLVVVVLGLTGWMGTSRIVRGEVLSLREREFVQAARALGMSDFRIIMRHVIPNTMAPVIVSATLGIGLTILTEASLSFLGLGVQPPTPSWGNMVADGRDALTAAWWITTFPGLAIVLTVVAFNLLGDGLRDALDPRLRT